jgi:erythronate-4-phosphate dehydrogenase
VKIVADQNMLMIAELFGHAGEIYSLPGRQICAADVADADVLLVRSVTR